MKTAWVWRGKLVPGVCKRDVLVFGGAEGSLGSKVAGRPTAGLRYQRQGSRIYKFLIRVKEVQTDSSSFSAGMGCRSEICSPTLQQEAMAAFANCLMASFEDMRLVEVAKGRG